jgi:prolyl-tRNA editing enzyme YbaK/EbsC (Cys-tRNA(Pro) deacylase)
LREKKVNFNHYFYTYSKEDVAKGAAIEVGVSAHEVVRAVGGISPFGTRKELPVYVEETILHLPLMYINGGRRGFLIEIAPSDLLRVLELTLVNVAIQ